MSNTALPYAAYSALQSCRLVALDKGPCVRSVGIGEIWKRGIEKCALKIVGKDVKAACGSTNLYAGLEAGIEGAIHSVSARAANAHCMEFGDWEVDDDVFARTAEEDEVQDSLPMRRAQATRAVASEAAAESTPTQVARTAAPPALPAFLTAATAQAAMAAAASAPTAIAAAEGVAAAVGVGHDDRTFPALHTQPDGMEEDSNDDDDDDKANE